MDISLIWVAAVILLGAFIQGLTGFGLALVSVPLLSLMLDVKLAVPVAGIFAWLVTIPLVIRMRAHIKWRIVFAMAIASIPGSLLGANLLKIVPGTYLLIAMGLVLVAASLHALKHKNAEKTGQTSLAVSGFAGFSSGILGASVGEPGPPAIAYLSMQSWTADQVKSTLLAFFMLQMIGALIGFWHKELLTEEAFHLFSWGVPSFIVGLLGGIKAWDWLKTSKINYQHAVHLFLLVIGAFLIVKNVYLLVK